LLYTAHDYGAKTCVLLQNFGYSNIEFFIPADLTIVPSLFSRDEYKRSIGLETVNIPPVIDFEPFRDVADVPQKERQALVFVNPSANKGVYWFVRLAKELWKKRLDIPILVVEGSSGREILANPSFGLEEVGNISFMSNTQNPEDFYKQARVIIVPSFFNESYARVVAEAMAAGVPVVASNRGALPETVGDAGLILDIPQIYQPQTTILPSAEEVQEWLAAIVRLWDDAFFWQTMCALGRERVERLWNEESVIDRYEEVLTKLILTN
ncbi:MAG: glycosyltransferase, partial [Thermoguttaceae bacterium]